MQSLKKLSLIKFGGRLGLAAGRGAADVSGGYTGKAKPHHLSAKWEVFALAAHTDCTPVSCSDEGAYVSSANAAPSTLAARRTCLPIIIPSRGRSKLQVSLTGHYYYCRCLSLYQPPSIISPRASIRSISLPFQHIGEDIAGSSIFRAMNASFRPSNLQSCS